MRKIPTIRLPTEEEFAAMRERNLQRARSNPNCFTHWYPSVVASGARTPRTLIIPFSDDEQMRIGEGGPDAGTEELADAVAAIRRFGEEVGYPLFLKNSLFSGKHSWERTCFIASADTLIDDHIAAISFEWAMLGNVCALHLVVREFIPTEAVFKAFEGTPITPEFRVFARDGAVESWQPYWCEEAFERQTPSHPNWQEALRAISTPTSAEFAEMKRLSEDVTSRLGGAWSVDFLRSRTGELWIIDLALASTSYVSPANQPFDN